VHIPTSESDKHGKNNEGCREDITNCNAVDEACCGNQPPRTTTSACMNGIEVYVPLKERLPVTSPRTKRCARSGVLAMPRANESRDGMPRKTT